MTLKSAKKLAKEMMRKHKVSHVFDFSFMDSKTTFGICYDSPDYLIQLSIPYVRLNGKKAVLDTILHEIAHARDILNRGYTKHDKVWKELCRDIGCSEKATFDSLEDNVIMPLAPYVVICQKCGYCEPKYRKPSKKPSVCQGCGYNNGLYKLIKQNDN